MPELSDTSTFFQHTYYEPWVDYAPRIHQGVVYACLDGNNVPIYIGQSANWGARRKRHSLQPWWAEVKSIKFLYVFHAWRRLIVEERLIRTYLPALNNKHTPRALGTAPPPGWHVELERAQQEIRDSLPPMPEIYRAADPAA